jgi:hypothetical protein
MKLIFALMVIMLAFVVPAHAQYPNPTDSCNQTLARTGVPQQNLTVFINIQTSGAARQFTPSELQDLQNYIVLDANSDFAKANESIRLTLTDDVSNANLIFNFNVVYNTDGTGRAYLEVRGLSVGHLFRDDESGQTPGDATVAVIDDMPQYLGPKGWVCASN